MVSAVTPSPHSTVPSRTHIGGPIVPVKQHIQDRENCKTTLQRNADVISGNMFRVTDPLRGEFTGHRWFPSQRPVTRTFGVFFDLRWTSGWVNNRDTGDLRRHRAHHDVTVMARSHRIYLFVAELFWGILNMLMFLKLFLNTEMVHAVEIPLCERQVLVPV